MDAGYSFDKPVPLLTFFYWFKRENLDNNRKPFPDNRRKVQAQAVARAIKLRDGLFPACFPRPACWRRHPFLTAPYPDGTMSEGMPPGGRRRALSPCRSDTSRQH